MYTYIHFNVFHFCTHYFFDIHIYIYIYVICIWTHFICAPSKFQERNTFYCMSHRQMVNVRLYILYTLLLFSFNFSIPWGACCRRCIFYEGILLYCTCMPWTHMFWPTRTHTTPNTRVNPHICIKQNTSVHATKHTHTHCKKKCTQHQTHFQRDHQASIHEGKCIYIYIYVYIYIIYTHTYIYIYIYVYVYVFVYIYVHIYVYVCIDIFIYM